MGPLIQQGIINPEWNPIIAFILGVGFGFVLEQAGFSTARKIVGVFYGFDMTVLRVFLTAVVTASLGLLYFNYLGWIDLTMIYINPHFYLVCYSWWRSCRVRNDSRGILPRNQFCCRINW
jgi:hypothetical protein